MITTTFTKETRDTLIGVVLRRSRSNETIVHGIRNGSIADKETDLLPGMRIQSVNGVSVAGMSLAQSIGMLKAVVGQVMIEATPAPQPMIVTARKDSKASTVGIGLARDGSGAIVVSSIHEKSIFDPKLLKRYMKVLKINGIVVNGMRKEEAIVLLRNAVGDISLEVIEYQPEAKRFH